MNGDPASFTLVDVFVRLGIALGLGMLIGFQRQRVDDDLAGIRTFPMVCVSGFVCGLLASELGGWLVAAGFVALAALVVMANLAKISAGRPDPGLTTEVALLLVYALGAWLAFGPPQVAVVVAGVMAVLLHLKPQLHGFTDRLADADVRAVMQFVLLSLVVLPVLPDRDYGPYLVWNPREIWWMVVLIVAISLAGYLGLKWLGGRAGSVLGGVLGGLVSSTATTLAFARRAKGEEIGDARAARVIQIAAAVVGVRVLVEMAIVAPALARAAALPVLAVTAALALPPLLGLRRDGEERHEPTDERNPTELRAALVFAALYAGVLLAVAWAKDRFGAGGLYGVAGLSGLADLDAITLSTAQLASARRLAIDEAWRVVLVALLANLVFKAGLVAVWGSRGVLRRVATAWAVVLLLGVALVLLWPGPAAPLAVG